MARGKSSELRSFIDYSVSKGVSREQIQKMLLDSGWPRELVDKIFTKPQKKGGVMLTAGNNAVKIINIRKSFGSNLVLDGIDAPSALASDHIPNVHEIIFSTRTKSAVCFTRSTKS